MKLLFIALLALSSPFFAAAQAPGLDEIYIGKNADGSLYYLNTKSVQAFSQKSSLSGAGEGQLIEFWALIKHTTDQEINGKIYKAPEAKTKLIANCTQMTYIILSATTYTSTGEVISTETRSPYSEIQDAPPGTVMAEIIEAACGIYNSPSVTTAPAPGPDEIYIAKDTDSTFSYLNTKSIRASTRASSLSDEGEGQLIEFWTRMKYTADQEFGGKIYKETEAKAKWIANCTQMTYIVLSATAYTSTGETIDTEIRPSYSRVYDAAPDTAMAEIIEAACRIYNKKK